MSRSIPDAKTPVLVTGGNISPTGLREIFIRDLVLDCSIGIHPHERSEKQRVRINLHLYVVERNAPIADRLANVVCYDDVITNVKKAVDDGHVGLIETLAERLAGLCLRDARIRRVHVSVEKLDVYGNVGSVGISIERLSSAINPLDSYR